MWRGWREVSENTVSRVIRNKGPIAEDTRRRVCRAIEELGYVPNRAAGSLASSVLAHHRRRTAVALQHRVPRSAARYPCRAGRHALPADDRRDRLRSRRRSRKSSPRCWPGSRPPSSPPASSTPTASRRMLQTNRIRVAELMEIDATPDRSRRRPVASRGGPRDGPPPGCRAAIAASAMSATTGRPTGAPGCAMTAFATGLATAGLSLVAEQLLRRPELDPGRPRDAGRACWPATRRSMPWSFPTTTWRSAASCTAWPTGIAVPERSGAFRLQRARDRPGAAEAAVDHPLQPFPDRQDGGREAAGNGRAAGRAADHRYGFRNHRGRNGLIASWRNAHAAWLQSQTI
ncbi:LacI family DNA-binding transcriptional regulator [Micropruina sp.]|uniref:LacI family DNA-binding transcriptional regulator n=1 Tax=Micropruina sp. TaxID=2737536 RepID=UPI0039E47BE5